jgi:hypothetical protein
MGLKMDQGRWKKHLPLFGMALLGVGLVFCMTRFGPGASGDSVHYVMGAENILAGKGYSRIAGGGEIEPITGFPPLYSVALAAMGFLGWEIFEGARFLQAILFGVNIFLVGFLIKRQTGSIGAALIGGLLVLSNVHQAKYHAWVMSEGLYILLMLLAIYALSTYLDSEKLLSLILAGAAISLATLTRYVGLSLAAAGGLALMLFGKGDWKKRLLDSLLLGAVSIVPVYLWVRRNAVVAGTMVNRELIFHPMRPKLMRVYVAEMLTWFVPRQLGLPRPIRNMLVLLLALPAPAIYVFRKLRESLEKNSQRPRKPLWTLPWILIFYVAAYLGILVINSTLLDAATTLSAPARYLAPVFVAAMIFLVMVFHDLLTRIRFQAALGVAVMTVVAVLVLVNASTIFPILQDPHMSIGYMGLRKLWPDTVAGLEALDPEKPLIANNPEMVYVLVGRTAYMEPLSFDPYKLEEKQDYDEQIAAAKEKLEAGGALVIFGPLDDHDREVIELLDAERIQTFYDSALFGYTEGRE